MSQLNVYVPDELERKIRKQAKHKGQTISGYLSSLFEARLGENRRWHRDFFTKVVGKWAGEFPSIERPLPEERDGL